MGNRRPREELADEARCTRTGRGWRCHNPRLPARVYCDRHHSLYLARLLRTKAAPPPPAGRPKRAPPPRPPPTAVDCLAPSLLSLAPGQVWALPHPPDGVPSAYARLDSVAAADDVADATAELTPLRPTDSNPATVPLSCGDFLPSGPPVIAKISSLSHRMFPIEKVEESSHIYTILPRRGEVWAVYHDWDDAEGRFVYRLVEVVSDFDGEEGVTAAALAPVEGSEEVLGRHLYEGFELLRSFGRAELARFSHRVPVVRVDGSDKDGGSLWLWKLVYW